MEIIFIESLFNIKCMNNILTDKQNIFLSYSHTNKTYKLTIYSKVFDRL
jgi:hypothetical protein